MRCRLWTCLVALLFAAPGLAQTAPAPVTAPNSPVKTDLSSPKAALLAVYAALKAGDVSAAEACLVFQNPAQAEYFDVSYAQLYAPLKLMHAMEARFGPAGRQGFANAPLERALDATVERVKTTEFQIQGDSAVVVDKKAAINPSQENELTGIAFKKQGDAWKIVAATFSDVGDGAEMPPAQLRLMRGMRDAVVTACQATEGRLRNGEFKSAEEAYADFQSRVQAGMQAALVTAARQK